MGICVFGLTIAGATLAIDLGLLHDGNGFVLPPMQSKEPC